MKAALVVAIVFAALAAVLALVDHPYSSRLQWFLLSAAVVALSVAHWPGLKP